MSAENVKIELSRKQALKDEFSRDYFVTLKSKLVEDMKNGYIVYPKPADMFNAFEMTPFDQVRVVILGQDPYHGAGQAHGLSFSVPDGISFPPSLKNIFKELADDLDVTLPKSGDLTKRAKQGVLLLNAFLSVIAAQPLSHSQIGREQFTDSVIKTVSDKKEHVVFVLRGAFAQGKRKLIDEKKHLILAAPHPSPLSSHRGFFGSKPFSQINDYLVKHDQTPIDWSLV